MIIVGQIIGWAAALLTFLSYQCKDHKKLIDSFISEIGEGNE